MKLPGATHLVVLCTTQAQAQRALELISQWMEQAQLQLHPQKTKIIDATQVGGFEFLGYHFERGHKWPRQKSVHGCASWRSENERAAPTVGNLGSTIAGINAQVLRGWYNYFRHGKVHTLRNLVADCREGYAVSCANEPNAKAKPKADPITADGPTASSKRRGCST